MLRELDRIRHEYVRREREIPAGFYGWARPVNLFFQTQLCRVLIRELDRCGEFPLDGKRVLDVGCGSGRWLLEFSQWGAAARDLHGLDLDQARLNQAARKLPAADLRCGYSRQLPWADSSFDLVTQFVMFTSILDAEVHRESACEMLRVTRPGGLIVWYDFRVDNPQNRNVRGISAARVRELFRGCPMRLKSVTLAPPLARLVVPASWPAAAALESVPFLRTHWLGLIRKPA